MKKLTKLLTLLTLSALTVLALGIVGCKDKAPDTSWDGRTYTVELYLADGTTPVKDVKLALCYNISETNSTCLAPARTDANGKAIFVVPETATVVGNPVIHFTHTAGNYNLPTGYGMPANVGAVVMNHPAGSDVAVYTYEYALALTEGITKLVLTAN